MVRVFKGILVVASLVISALGRPTDALTTVRDVQADISIIGTGPLPQLHAVASSLPDNQPPSGVQLRDLGMWNGELVNAIKRTDADVQNVVAPSESEAKAILDQLRALQSLIDSTIDIMANKADTSFKNQLVLKSVIGDQIVALYEVYRSFALHLLDKCPPSLKADGNALFQDGKKHFEACLAKYGKNVPV